jgi:hypothetical protein
MSKLFFNFPKALWLLLGIRDGEFLQPVRQFDCDKGLKVSLSECWFFWSVA